MEGIDLQVFADDAAQESTVGIPGTPEVPSPVSGEAIAEASGNLGARLRARLDRIRTEETRLFSVPGWGGDLVIRSGYFSPETWESLSQERTDALIIVSATAALLSRGDDGLSEIEGGWGPQLAEMLGFPRGAPPTRLVTAVMGDRAAWVSALATDIVSWQMGRTPRIEEALGE